MNSETTGFAAGPMTAAAGPKLLPHTRRRLILRRLEADGGVRVAQASAELGVSEATARRDMENLARAGHGTKVHGGIVAAG